MIASSSVGEATKKQRRDTTKPLRPAGEGKESSFNRITIAAAAMKKQQQILYSNNKGRGVVFKR